MTEPIAVTSFVDGHAGRLVKERLTKPGLAEGQDPCETPIGKGACPGFVLPAV
ncbi:MAG: hypothetical protein KDA81_12670 [Planctomycetaceae bacterium]|nr:hypothetical protein [Planctomycetaceae bacterium]